MFSPSGVMRLIPSLRLPGDSEPTSPLSFRTLSRPRRSFRPRDDRPSGDRALPLFMENPFGCRVQNPGDPHYCLVLGMPRDIPAELMDRGIGESETSFQRSPRRKLTTFVPRQALPREPYPMTNRRMRHGSIRPL